VVIGWEEWSNIGLADKAEELLPATWDNETYEFCMGGVNLILMYGSLLIQCGVPKSKYMKENILTGGTLAKSPGPKERALSFAQTLSFPFRHRKTSWASLW
jgi:hypothetical protein